MQQIRQISPILTVPTIQLIQQSIIQIIQPTSLIILQHHYVEMEYCRLANYVMMAIPYHLTDAHLCANFRIYISVRIKSVFVVLLL